MYHNQKLYEHKYHKLLDGMKTNLVGMIGTQSYEHINHGNSKQYEKVQLNKIWEVVSSLAQALMNARNQLGNLIASQDQQHKFCNFKTLNTPFCAHQLPNYMPTAGAHVANLHREHVHGHMAFGCNSEYRPQVAMRPRNKICADKCVDNRTMSPLRRRNYDMTFRTNNLPWKHLPRTQLKLHLLNENNFHINAVQRVSARKCGAKPDTCNRDQHLNVHFTHLNNVKKENCGGDGNVNNCINDKISSTPLQQKNHCIGTRYAQLLKEETYQLRERRLVEECKAKKPKWCFC
jgi:hypothetical protein